MTHNHQCTQYLPELSDYLDGELSPNLCADLERHMVECERCRIVVDTTRKTIELYRSSTNKQEAPSDVKERLYKRLNLEDYLVQPNKHETDA